VPPGGKGGREKSEPNREARTCPAERRERDRGVLQSAIRQKRNIFSEGKTRKLRTKRVAYLVRWEEREVSNQNGDFPHGGNPDYHRPAERKGSRQGK